MAAPTLTQFEAEFFELTLSANEEVWVSSALSTQYDLLPSSVWTVAARRSRAALLRTAHLLLVKRRVASFQGGDVPAGPLTSVSSQTNSMTYQASGVTHMSGGLGAWSDTVYGREYLTLEAQTPKLPRVGGMLS